MPSRDKILSIYQAGPDALVVWVEHLLATHAGQTEHLPATQAGQTAHLLANQALLEQQVQVLTARLAELEMRLNKESHNSHQPPSTDGPAKRPHPRSLRKSSGKKRGGQAGHPGVTRCLVTDPDLIVEHVPAICSGCGASLAAAPEVSRERRQVIEIPKPQPEITEHQAVRLACPACEHMTSGAFPPDVSQPVQYGPRTKAAAVYLQTYQLLPAPRERTVEALIDLFGVSPSQGTLARAQATAYASLEPVEQAVGATLRQAEVVHVDETGQRVAGHTEWVHVISTTLLTFYTHHAKRGREAIDAIGLLLDFKGRRVHDAWAPYLQLPGLYALRNAHLLRELVGLHEDTQQAWMQKLIRLLLRLQAAVVAAQAAGQTELTAKQRAGYEAAYTRFVNEGLRANPPPKTTGRRGRPKRTPARNLLDRLVTHRDAILAFLHDFRVPFDNNQAERDLRMLKVKGKVSGCFRSPEGADQFCRIRGYISTLRKQGYSVLDGLTSIFVGQPLMPRQEAGSVTTIFISERLFWYNSQHSRRPRQPIRPRAMRRTLCHQPNPTASLACPPRATATACWSCMLGGV
jgi:transposase